MSEIIEIRELPENASTKTDVETYKYNTKHYNESKRVKFEDEIAREIPNLVEWSGGHQQDVEYDHSEYSLFQRKMMELSFMHRYWIMKALHENDTERYFHLCGRHGIRHHHAQHIRVNYLQETQS